MGSEELQEIKKNGSQLRSYVWNKKERPVLCGLRESNHQSELSYSDPADTELLGRKVEEFSKKADCDKFEVALALAIEGLDVSYDFYHEEIDEDFERQKRMI